MVAGGRTLGGVDLNLCDIPSSSATFPSPRSVMAGGAIRNAFETAGTIRRWLARWTPPVIIDGEAAEQTATPAMARPFHSSPAPRSLAVRGVQVE
jgi:hypothetical protein